MKTKERNGISLIVLIITIIVVIILAAVVILTLSKNNPIESAKEARFKEDVRTFQDEFALAVSKEYASAGGHRDEKISTSNFDEIKEYIPSFSEKYRDKFVIKDDELVYTTKLDEKEKEYAQSLNIRMCFIQLEYLESNGTQYIDTNKYLSLNTQINSKFLFIGQNNNSVVYGNKFVDGQNIWSLGIIPYNNYMYTGFGDKFDITYEKDVTWSTASEYVHNQFGVWVNNIQKVVYSNSKMDSNLPSIYLFARNNMGNTDRYSCVRIYYFQIYEDGKLVLDLIPVLDFEGVPCMYDKLTNELLYNQGSGENFKYKLKE